jgi:hypothetical protein
MRRLASEDQNTGVWNDLHKEILSTESKLESLQEFCLEYELSPIVCKEAIYTTKICIFISHGASAEKANRSGDYLCLSGGCHYTINGWMEIAMLKGFFANIIGLQKQNSI